MLPFYALSVLINGVTGLLLLLANQEPADSIENSSTDYAFFNTKVFRLVIGILAVFIAIIKIFSTMEGYAPLIGDLLPVLAGLFGGSCLLYEYYKASTTIPHTLPTFFQKVFVDGRKYLGIACIIIAILHLIFPRAVGL